MLLGACGTGNRVSTEQLISTGGGGLVGGYLGYQFGGGTGQLLAALIGAGIGAAAGYSLGRDLAPDDRAQMQATTLRAMREAADGQLMTWHNGRTGVVGTVTPMRSYYAREGVFCRDFEASIAVAAGVGAGKGRACRVDNGPWQFAGKV